MLSNSHTSKALLRTYLIRCRSYYTKRKIKNEASLYARISPLGNPNVDVTPELENWVEEGHKVRFAELQRIIIDLRKRKRFSQALQVSEWMGSKGLYTFSPVQHAVQLDLIGKVHGFLAAERYFDSLSEQDKTGKVNGALLHCYVRQRESERASAHFQKMKENGLALSSVAFNDIMCLYSNIGWNDKVPEILNQMKEKGVQPDNLSYRICINSYGVRSDIEGLEKVLKEMENDSHVVMDWNTYAVVANFYTKADLQYRANIILKKAEGLLDAKDSIGYNHLISLHARLGNKDDVLRLWDLEKIACKRCLNKDYIVMLESLVRLDELEQAERVLEEWNSSGNCYDFRVPSVVIVGYIGKGLNEKAEALLKYLMVMGRASSSNIWAKLAAGYLENGNMEKALMYLKVALSLPDASEGFGHNDKLITRILSLVGEKGTSDYAQNVVNLLKSAVPLKRQMYHALLKSSVVGGKEVDRILGAMKDDHLEEDESTLEILSLKQKAM